MRRSDKQIRLRAEAIVKVRAGQMSAAEAARQLGVSRKTYYKWEQRGLEGLLDGLCDRDPGRPSTALSKEVQSLQAKVAELERELDSRDQRDQLRQAIARLTEKKG